MIVIDKLKRIQEFQIIDIPSARSMMHLVTSANMNGEYSGDAPDYTNLSKTDSIRLAQLLDENQRESSPSPTPSSIEIETPTPSES